MPRKTQSSVVCGLTSIVAKVVTGVTVHEIFFQVRIVASSGWLADLGAPCVLLVLSEQVEVILTGQIAFGQTSNKPRFEIFV